MCVTVSEIRLRSVFIHVDVCGQEDNAGDLESFPTIQQLGLILIDLFNLLLMIGIIFFNYLLYR